MKQTLNPNSNGRKRGPEEIRLSQNESERKRRPRPDGTKAVKKNTQRAKKPQPRLVIEDDNPYVEQTDGMETYDLIEVAGISAVGFGSGDPDSFNLLVDDTTVDYEKPGTYVATVSAMDFNGNLLMEEIKVRVLSHQEADQLEDEQYDDYLEESLQGNKGDNNTSFLGKLSNLFSKKKR